MLLDFLNSPRWVDSSVFGLTSALDNLLKAVGEKFEDAQNEIRTSCANVQRFNYTFYGKHTHEVISSIIKAKLDDAVFSTVIIGSKDVKANVILSFPDDKLEFTYEWCPKYEHFVGGVTGDKLKLVYNEDTRTFDEFPEKKELAKIEDVKEPVQETAKEPDEICNNAVCEASHTSVSERLKSLYTKEYELVDYEALVLEFLEDVFSDESFPFEPLYDEDSAEPAALSMNYSVHEGTQFDDNAFVPKADDVDWEYVTKEVCDNYGFSDMCYGPENGAFTLKFIF